MNIEEKKIIEKIKEIAKVSTKFPDGRIDYSKADTAIVLTVFVQYRDEILLLKRSDKVGTYKGLWNTVTGYLDEARPIIEKIKEELREELDIDFNIIESYSFGKSFQFTDSKINKTWIVYPARIKLKQKPEIKLDWEHIEYIWIKPEDMKKYKTVPNLHLSLERGLLI